MPTAELSAEISTERLQGWAHKFSLYREAPSVAKLRSWFRRFDVAHQGVAAKLLDLVTIVPERVIQQGYRSALDQIPGWSRRAADRSGKWVFVGWGGAGESGPAMLRSFREAHNLALKQYNELFKTPAELALLRLDKGDTLVFVDDFSGSGKQVCDNWPEMSMIIGGEPDVYLVLTGSTEQALSKIKECSPIEVLTRFILKGKRLLTTPASPLSDDEQNIILSYCKLVDKNNPKGFGGCGLAFILHHKTPNNCLPILYANKASWRGPFPRHLAGHL